MKAEAADSIAKEREGEAVVPIVAFVDLVIPEQDLVLLYGELEGPFFLEMSEEFSIEVVLQAMGDGIVGLVESQGLLSFDEQAKEALQGHRPRR
jgi:hypothetical protein